jgi:hypothetical protein
MEKIIENFLRIKSTDKCHSNNSNYKHDYDCDYGSGYGNGYGSGNGSGNGSGYGYGSGNGSGYGYGSGYGSGYGNGYGSGYGNGYGYGFSSGYGNGSGSGSGSGPGSGYGSDSDYDSDSRINSITLNGIKFKIYLIDSIQTVIEKVKGNIAAGFLLNSDLSFTPCFVVKVHNYFAHGGTIKEAKKDAFNKYRESIPLDILITQFKKLFENNNKVIASTLYDWHGTLTKSCKLGRDKFVIENNINLKSSLTLKEFISLTENSYGGEIIKKLK